MLETYDFSSQSVQLLLQVVDCRWRRGLLVMMVLITSLMVIMVVTSLVMVILSLMVIMVVTMVMVIMSLIPSRGLEPFNPLVNQLCRLAANF